jgi:hypothetical protein
VRDARVLEAMRKVAQERFGALLCGDNSNDQPGISKI